MFDFGNIGAGVRIYAGLGSSARGTQSKMEFGVSNAPAAGTAGTVATPGLFPQVSPANARTLYTAAVGVTSLKI